MARTKKDQTATDPALDPTTATAGDNGGTNGGGGGGDNGGNGGTPPSDLNDLLVIATDKAKLGVEGKTDGEAKVGLTMKSVMTDGPLKEPRKAVTTIVSTEVGLIIHQTTEDIPAAT
jgi:hypothetical protein